VKKSNPDREFCLVGVQMLVERRGGVAGDWLADRYVS